MNTKIAIFLGSSSDKPIMKKGVDILKKFNIGYKSYVISAHRLPDILSNTIKKVESKGIDLIISGAGLSAHLPGIIASKTILPVIGIPFHNCMNKNGEGSLGGLDALFSIIQMPKDIPVATVGINNSYNAALLAIHILSMKYENIKKLLVEFRMEKKERLLSEIEQHL